MQDQLRQQGLFRFISGDGNKRSNLNMDRESVSSCEGFFVMESKHYGRVYGVT